MSTAPDPKWEPELQWLAAYLDGELEGRDDMADRRARVEAWLEAHPEALEQCAEQKKLQQLWLETTPAEPTPSAWARCRAGIDAKRIPQQNRTPRGRRSWIALSALAASVILVVGIGFGIWRVWQADPHNHAPVAVAPHHQDDDEVLEVAQSHEITILRVEGADTESLVVGTPPLEGELELAGPGEVRVLHVRPAARDQMIANVRTDGRPMVWARIDAD
jgi:anti-sigma factor RsiW